MENSGNMMVHQYWDMIYPFLDIPKSLSNNDLCADLGYPCVPPATTPLVPNASLLIIHLPSAN